MLLLLFKLYYELRIALEKDILCFVYFLIIFLIFFLGYYLPLKLLVVLYDSLINLIVLQFNFFYGWFLSKRLYLTKGVQYFFFVFFFTIIDTDFYLKAESKYYKIRFIEQKQKRSTFER